MRLDLKFYLMYGYIIHMALNLSKYKQIKQINSNIYTLTDHKHIDIHNISCKPVLA